MAGGGAGEGESSGGVKENETLPRGMEEGRCKADIKKR